jgi:hypothetical protein
MPKGSHVPRSPKDSSSTIWVNTFLLPYIRNVAEHEHLTLEGWVLRYFRGSIKSEHSITSEMRNSLRGQTGEFYHGATVFQASNNCCFLEVIVVGLISFS